MSAQYAKFGRRIFEQSPSQGVHRPSRAITADSIESLAHRLDIENVEQAVETVEEYNAACDPNVAEQYDPEILDGNSTEELDLPRSNWALPLGEPPYSVYPVTGGMTFAFGVIAITPRVEVLDMTDSVIPACTVPATSPADCSTTTTLAGPG